MRVFMPEITAAVVRFVLFAAGCHLGLVGWLGFPDQAPGQANSPDVNIGHFFAKHCTSCHGAEKPRGDLSLENRSVQSDMKKHPQVWQKIIERLQLREMPPEGKPQPSAVERAEAIIWLTGKLREAGHGADLDRKLSDFAYGNYIDHDALFQSKLKVAIPAEPRLWRLSPQIYEEFVDDVGGDGVAQPFSLRPGKGIKDYASAFLVDEQGVVQLLRNAEQIVKDQTRDSEDRKTGKTITFGRAPRPLRALVEGDGPPTRKTIEEAIRYQFQRVLLRDPTSRELEGFTKLMQKNIKDAGNVQGSRATLAAVFLLPEAVFRMELGEGHPDEYGRVKLSPRELAFAISYALTDDRPDGDLLRAAAEGKLSTAEDVKREVERVWNNPRKDKTRILRFFREYFGYHHAEDVFKDGEVVDEVFNGRFRTEILVRDTDQLIEWILKKDKNVLRELLTTNKSFVNTRYDNRKDQYIMSHTKNLMNRAYNVSKDQWSRNQPMTLPKDERAGILTQPSWLVAHSDNNDGHPILRGKWIQERLLGGTVPDLPISVDAQLPEAPEKTLRQRLAVTEVQYCWKCHQRMNPMGLTFESYSDLGVFRKEERVLDPEATAKNVDKKGRPQGPVFKMVPIDPSGAITHTGVADLDGKVAGAIEMIHKLAESERVRQVFVRHVFRYFMGRNERLGDAPTLIAADRVYVKSGGSFKALVVSLLTSDSFMYRKVPDSIMGK